MSTAVATPWNRHRRRVFQSVFQTEVSQPTPQSTPCIRFPDQGQAFGGPASSAVRASELASERRPLSGPLFSQPAAQGHGHPHAPSTTAATFASFSSSESTIPAPSQSGVHLPQPLFPSLATAGNDQVTYDRAWHVVTARIALPASATADDSFGTLPPDSQLQPASQQVTSSEHDFYEALTLLVHASTLLPRATHTEDVVAWHAQQVRAHFAQHVIPLLSGCVDEDPVQPGSEVGDYGAARGKTPGERRESNHYQQHMVMVMSSIRTLEAALRLYFYGLGMLARGFGRLADGSGSEKAAAEAEDLATRFRRDIHALIGNSASSRLMGAIRVVLVRLTSTILGIPAVDDEKPSSARSGRPALPTNDDLRPLAARQRLHELVEQLHSVGLAGERFQLLFAEIMESMMSKFVTGAYANVWAASPSELHGFPDVANTISRSSVPSSSSPCIASLEDWVENHFARLSFEVLSRVSSDSPSEAVSLDDVKTYQSLALARLAALRTSELFDIIMAWPSSRSALDDLRATINTTDRRLELTESFSRVLKKRLLHPGCSTLEILRTYISIIRTLHALDNSKVLLGHIEPDLQLYLCQREDAIRVVVTGLLASPDEIEVARKVKETAKRRHQERRPKTPKPGAGPFMTPAVPARPTITPSAVPARTRRDSTPDPAVDTTTTDISSLGSSDKLVELALLLNDPSQARRAAPEEEELDWNDMTWVPDPVDAGANYKRPKSEDVIGTLISALGSEDVFIKEFSSVVAGRLLGEPTKLDQELRVLDLLKRRFGEAALQNCDVMIRDVQDSKKVDATILRARAGTAAETLVRTPAARKGQEEEAQDEYHARILSRLFWPDLEREHFLLPAPVVEYQEWYERGYEELKSKRKLTWLNQLGQARVELELDDRTVTVDCSTVQATVIYAFQGDGDGKTVKRTADELYEQLQMDEDYIAEALNFWASKGVLRKTSQGAYAVIESLTSKEGEGAKGEEEGGAARKPDAKAGLSSKEVERRAMYWQYIQGMLTNSKVSMPITQMIMMMKVLSPDGFPWSKEELQQFLAEKAATGEIQVIGGKYKLVKK
ncbi:hypothetical protein OQA88_5712 [Cercophora sp. LCS_1]